MRERLAFVRSRFQPPRFVLDVPADVTLKAFCTLEGMRGDVPVAVGENRLPPGMYELTLGEDGVRLPLHVPLVVRDDTEPHADHEAAWMQIALPLHPDEVPSGYVLVPGGQVRPRDLPFTEASPEQAVAPFLLSRREITNSEYATFLRAQPAGERAGRAPQTGILVGGRRRLGADHAGRRRASGRGCPPRGRPGLRGLAQRPRQRHAAAAQRGGVGPRGRRSPRLRAPGRRAR